MCFQQSCLSRPNCNCCQHQLLAPWRMTTHVNMLPCQCLEAQRKGGRISGLWWTFFCFFYAWAGVFIWCTGPATQLLLQGWLELMAINLQTLDNLRVLRVWCGQGAWFWYAIWLFWLQCMWRHLTWFVRQCLSVLCVSFAVVHLSRPPAGRFHTGRLTHRGWSEVALKNARVCLGCEILQLGAWQSLVAWRATY